MLLSNQQLEQLIGVLVACMYVVWPVLIWRMAVLSREEKAVEAKKPKND